MIYLKDSPTSLISSAVAIGSAYTIIGETINTKNIDKLALWVKVTAGSSTDITFKAIGKLSLDDTNEYIFPIKTVSASAISVQPEVFALEVDANTNLVYEIDLNGVVPFLEFKVKDGNDSTGTVDLASITYIPTTRRI